MEPNRTLEELLQSKEGQEKLVELATLYALFQQEQKKQLVLDLPAHIEQLKQLAADLAQKTIFKVGDLVVWKKGHINRSVPSAQEPAIVLEVFETPIINDQVDFASTYYREKYDLLLGVLREGSLVSFHYPSVRFQPFNL